MKLRTGLCLAALSALVIGASSAPAARAPSLQRAFASAAREFGVPPSVLLAVAYNESRWEHHGGRPSTWGGYGVMHLTAVPAVDRGTGKDGLASPATASQTLAAAAALLGESQATLKADPAQNIRGGAALLARYARQTVGRLPADPAQWYGAVAKYSGSRNAAVARDFADAVYATMRSGRTRVTSYGERITLAPARVRPDRATAAPLALRGASAADVDCPTGLRCLFVPAAYRQNSADPSDYGNYDLANREADGLDVSYVVIHDTETTYQEAIDIFSNPLAYVSAHYVIRSSDGEITQMVRTKNVAWHAGNWYVNSHAVGIEDEGVAIEGATWYTEQLYRSAAKLTRYLAQRYDIPLDRAHIVGHDDVPGPTAAFQPGMHWDPGPYWDWAHFMALVGAPITPAGGDGTGRIVTIAPTFATNRPPVTDCQGGGGAVAPQPASFVYLRTAPSAGAPLVDDPALPGPGTTCANDWGDKAATGQTFVVAERQGDWTAIWFGGQKAWFSNPNGTNTVPGAGRLVTPRAGLASIPVYGRAYPSWSTATLQYTIPAGQVYVAKDYVPGSYYSATTFNAPETYVVEIDPSVHYYEIFFNHRFAFVNADDVTLVQ